MVDDRRRAPLEGLERPQHRRPPDHLEIEGAVEPPPHELKGLAAKIARACAGRRGHPAGQRRVEVVVPADQSPGHSRARRGQHPQRPWRRSVVRGGRSPADRRVHRQCRAPEPVEVVQRAGHGSGCRHRADLPHAFDPIGGPGLGRLHENDLDRWHVLRPDDPEAPKRHVLWSPLLVTGELLRERVTKSHVHGTLDLALAQEGVDGPPHVVDQRSTLSMLPVSRSMTTSWAA